MTMKIISFIQADYVWIVPRGELIPHWLGMLLIFQPTVWYSGFAFVGLVCIVIWLLAQCKVQEVPCYTRFKDISLIVIGIIMNNIPPKMPKTWRIRIVFILWLFFCINWTSAYTSSLITMITTTLEKDNQVWGQPNCEGINYSMLWLFSSAGKERDRHCE